MFSETRYAMNGDLRVAYRASREGPRDIVYVPNWFTCVGPQRSATVTGMRCSTRTTPSCGRSSLGFEAAR